MTSTRSETAPMRSRFGRNHVRRALSGAVIAVSVVLVAAASAPHPSRASRASADPAVADAEMRGDTAMVRALIKQGSDVNAAQGDGMTALHWAASHGDAEQTRMLIY